MFSLCLSTNLCFRGSLSRINCLRLCVLVHGNASHVWFLLALLYKKRMSDTDVRLFIAISMLLCTKSDRTTNGAKHIKKNFVKTCILAYAGFSGS